MNEKQIIIFFILHLIIVAFYFSLGNA